MKTTETPSLEDVVAVFKVREPQVELPGEVRDAVVSAKRALAFIGFARRHHIPVANLSPNSSEQIANGWVIEQPTPGQIGTALLETGHTFRCVMRGNNTMITREQILHPYASEEAMHVLAAAALVGLSQHQPLPSSGISHIPEPRSASQNWQPGLYLGAIR